MSKENIVYGIALGRKLNERIENLRIKVIHKGTNIVPFEVIADVRTTFSKRVIIDLGIQCLEHFYKGDWVKELTIEQIEDIINGIEGLSCIGSKEFPNGEQIFYLKVKKEELKKGVLKKICPIRKEVIKENDWNNG